MDSVINLSYGKKTTFTIISNTFIDKYMTNAIGGYVKVYLYLLRCVQDPTRAVSLKDIALTLDEEEKYIKMALQYWHDQKLIELVKSRDNTGTQIITNIIIHDDSIPDSPAPENDAELIIPTQSDTHINKQDKEKNKYINKPTEMEIKPVYSDSTISAYMSTFEFSHMINKIESEITAKKLCKTEIQLICYLYEQKEFEPAAISYLYEYCNNILDNYDTAAVESVAREWISLGIKTLEDAKYHIMNGSETVKCVKYALGITDNFKPAEMNMIMGWSKKYHMSNELISEACNKAVLQTNPPSLVYIEKIIKTWHDKNVSTIEDVKTLDSEFQQSKQTIAAKTNKTKDTTQGPAKSANKYFQYPQRSYSESELKDMELKKLKKSKLFA